AHGDEVREPGRLSPILALALAPVEGTASRANDTRRAGYHADLPGGAVEPVLAGTFRVGSVKGITIRIHFLFVLLCLLVLLQGGDTAGSAMLLGVLFGSVFLHELGHCFGARAV